MKKLLLLTITIFGILTINSCSKKDIKIDDPQEETPTETHPEEKKPANITFKTYSQEDGRGVIELVSDTTTSKIYFYGNFDGEQEENLLVNAVTYQSPGGDSLYHFILDDKHRVERMYITFPDGSFDTTLITLSYPHPDTTVVSSYYYNWETNENRLHFRTKTYYKNGKLTAHQSGRFSLSEFKDVSLKTVFGSVIAAVGVVEAAGAVIALATTAPAWAIVGAGIAIVAFTNSAMASDEMVLSETPFQGPVSPAAHVIPNLPEASDEDTKNTENIFTDAAIVREILSANGLAAASDSRWDSTGIGILVSVLGENGCVLSQPLSQNSRIVGLILENKDLTVLPEAIGGLTSLQQLFLLGNKLTSLPDSIENLVDLVDLDLSNNQFTVFPSPIENLVNLKGSLDLMNNQLTTLPERIGNLVKLGSLYLGGNQLTTLPSSIGNLVNLTQLSLTGNQLTALPSSIGNLVNLTYLLLHGNQLTTLPSSIGNLVNLIGLYLSDNQLVSLSEGIGNLVNLTHLFLQNNQLAALPSSIGNLVNLEGFLYIENNQLTTLPDGIGNLVNLTGLSLYDNQLTTLPSSIGNLVNLTDLYLYDNQLTSLPSSIGNLVNLGGDLSLNNNQLISLPSSIGNLINLTSLSLSYNQLTDIPSSIGNLVNLTNLNLSYNQLTDIPSSIGNLINLTILSSSNNQLTVVPSSIGNLANLTHLNLSKNKLVEIPPTFGNLTNLKALAVNINSLKCLPQSVWNLGSSVVRWSGNTYLKEDSKSYGLCSFGDTICDDIPCSEH